MLISLLSDVYISATVEIVEVHLIRNGVLILIKRRKKQGNLLVLSKFPINVKKVLIFYFFCSSFFLSFAPNTEK